MSKGEPREPEPLRADAQRMLSLWRTADAMPRAVHARVWQRLRAPKRAPVRSDGLLIAVLAFGIAAAVLLAIWGVGRLLPSMRRSAGPRSDPQAEHGQAQPSPTGTAIDVQPANAPPRASMPAPAVTLPPAPTPVVEAPAPGPTSMRPRSPASHDAAASDDAKIDERSTRIARERDLIERAWSALAEGDPRAALDRCAEHERAFPDGLLAPERAAIAVIARCKRGDAGAIASADAWLAAEPRSPLAGRVRAACVASP
jgi:hypothetical protein